MSPLCRFCRHPNPAGAKFCNECGSPLHLRPCPSCEAITDAAANTCHQCGASFDGDTTVIAPAAATPLEAPSQASDTQSATARDARADLRHVPEFFAERLEGSPGSLGASSHPEVEQAEATGPRWREPVAPRHVVVGDGREMIADDALDLPQAASERPAVVEEASAAFIDTDDDRYFRGREPSATAPDARSAAESRETRPIPIPDAADRPARPRSRGNAWRPAAWLVAFAALAAGGYYAYVERGRLLPELADVVAGARSLRGQGSQEQPAARPAGGQDAANAAVPEASPPATTADVPMQAPSADGAPAQAPANDAKASGASPDPTATDARAAATEPAGDAATAQRAVANSRASTTTPPAGDAPSGASSPGTTTPPARDPAAVTKSRASTTNRTPAAPAARTSTTGRNPAPAPARNATTSSATSKRSGIPKPADASDSANPARAGRDTVKSADPDALATRRLIERELGAFLPQDAKRTTQEPAPTRD